MLGWGVSTAILFSLPQGCQNGWDGFLATLIPALILLPLGGRVWGRLMWKFLEIRHALKSEPSRRE